VTSAAVGAGSRDTARYGRGQIDRARAHVQRLLGEGRSVLLQPYLGRVDAQGETAVLYLGGTFSHSIRKGPLLRRGAGMVEGLFAPEDIRPRAADPDELAVAAAAYAAIPFQRPAYARIDLLRDARGAPVVLELEMTEPSLFLDHSPGAATRFARWLVQELRATAPVP
jgi:O-ureido-D-serine cyclo-ligase